MAKRKFRAATTYFEQVPLRLVKMIAARRISTRKKAAAKIRPLK